MTCLTLTPASVAEAIESRAELVVAHHPLPFKALSKLTTQTQTGRMLWQLARAGVSVYSPHTAWDSAATGINARLAQLLELQNCRPIVPNLIPGSDTELTVAANSTVGAGRLGELSNAQSLNDVKARICRLLSDCRPRGIDSGRTIRHVAIACGSGASLMAAALAVGPCDLFLTGEGTFHSCLEAQAAGISLLMVGHFASEHFAMVQLASELQVAHPRLSVWASQQEKDPVVNFAL